MGITSYAQNFEDVILWRALGKIENGVYVDIGAHHPEIDSISKAFYDHGWRGVNVEPGTSQAALLRAARPRDITIEAMVAENPGVLRFYETPGGGLSTGRKDIAEEHRKNLNCDITETFVTAITLDDALAIAPGDDIHWLKVDVEGLERSVILSWRKSPRRPWIIVIEATHPMTQFATHEDWEQLVLEKGYSLVYRDGLNRYYLSDRHAELQPHFELPPNVFDDFQLEEGISSLFTRSIRERFSREWVQQSERIANLESQLAAARKQLQNNERGVTNESTLTESVETYPLEAPEREDRMPEHHLAQAELEAVRHQLAPSVGEWTGAPEAARVQHESKAERVALHLAEHQSQIDRLAEKLAETEAQVRHVTERIAESQTQEAQLIQQVEESRSAVRKLTQRLADSQLEVGDLTQRIEESHTEVGGLIRQVMESQNDVRSLTSQVAENHFAVQHLTQHVGQSQSQIVLLAEKLAENRSDTEHLGRQVVEIQSHQARLHELYVRSTSRQLPWPLRLWGHRGDTLAHYPRAVHRSSVSPAGMLAAAESKPQEIPMTLDDLLSLPDEEFLRAAYVLILGREPDEAGLDNYRKKLVRGASKSAIAAAIAQSDEAKARADHQDLAHLSDDDFVDAIYNRLLGRSPDPDGKNHYRERLRRNGDRERIVRSLEESDEALRHNPAGAYFRRDLNMLVRRERRRMRWLKWGEPNSVRYIGARQTAIQSLSNAIAQANATTSSQIGGLVATIDALVNFQRAEFSSIRSELGGLRAAVDALSEAHGAELASMREQIRAGINTVDGAAKILHETSATATATRDHVRLLTAVVEGMGKAKGFTTAKR